MLAADPSAPRRRVVLAAEVADQHVLATAGFAAGPGPDHQPILLRDIVSGHVDDPAAIAEIAAAAAAISAADDGDDDARFVVDGAEGFDLQWYATQELGDLSRWPD